jgi:hypothetical protein
MNMARMFGNEVLRKIFWSKRDTAEGNCRKLHNKELHYLCSSLDIIRVIKLRSMRQQNMWQGEKRYA